MLTNPLKPPRTRAASSPPPFFCAPPPYDAEILNILKYVRPGGGFVPAFPLTQVSTVNGVFTDATIAALKASCPSPVTTISDGGPSWSPITISDFTWNFNAVLIGKDGTPRYRFDTGVAPQATVPAVQELLSE